LFPFLGATSFLLLLHLLRLHAKLQGNNILLKCIEAGFALFNAIWHYYQIDLCNQAERRDHVLKIISIWLYNFEKDSYYNRLLNFLDKNDKKIKRINNKYWMKYRPA
jgi:hypothetical protein